MRVSWRGERRLSVVMSFAAVLISTALGVDTSFGQGQDHYDQGWAAESEREFDAAIDQYTLAIEAGDLSGQTLSQVYARRAGTWAHLCENGRAIADFSRAIDLDPSNGVAYSLRGYLRGLSGQVELAELDHRQALALADQQTWEDYRPWALQHFADLYRRQGNYERALELCDEALGASDYSTVYFRRAWIHLDQRDRQAASADFAIYLSKSAEQEVSYNLLWPDEEIAFSRLEGDFKNR